MDQRWFEDCQLRPRDIQRENNLKMILRRMPKSGRHKVLLALVQRDVVVGLDLAKSTSNDRELFIKIMMIGLESSTISDVEVWMDCVVSKLGIRRVARLLVDSVSDINVMQKALYGLSRVVPENDKRSQEVLVELNRFASEAL